MQGNKGPWVSLSCFKQLEASQEHSLLPIFQAPAIGEPEQAALVIHSSSEKELRSVELHVGIMSNLDAHSPLVGVILLCLNHKKVFRMFLDFLRPSAWNLANAAQEGLNLVLFNGRSSLDQQVIPNTIAHFQQRYMEGVAGGDPPWSEEEFESAVHSILAEYPSAEAMFAEIHPPDRDDHDRSLPGENLNN